MIYISDIIAENGSKPEYIVVTGSVPSFNVELTDSETGKVKVVSGHSWDNRFALGYGVCRTPNATVREAITKYSRKQALLHEHILECRTLSGVDLIDVGEIDCFIYGQTISENISGPKRVVGVNMVKVELIMCDGVVCRKADWSDNYMACPLWDVLAEICRESQHNILQYETIFIYSRMLQITTQIRLKQDADSKRFFTKMFLDVML